MHQPQTDVHADDWATTPSAGCKPLKQSLAFHPNAVFRSASFSSSEATSDGFPMLSPRAEVSDCASSDSGSGVFSGICHGRASMKSAGGRRRAYGDLRPFSSKPFRKAHSQASSSFQARQWSHLNLSKLFIAANHARCAACRPQDPTMPADSPASHVMLHDLALDEPAEEQYVIDDAAISTAASDVSALTDVEQQECLPTRCSSTPRLCAGHGASKFHAVGGRRSIAQLRRRSLSQHAKPARIVNTVAAPSVRTRVNCCSRTASMHLARALPVADAPLPHALQLGSAPIAAWHGMPHSGMQASADAHEVSLVERTMLCTPFAQCSAPGEVGVACASQACSPVRSDEWNSIAQEGDGDRVRVPALSPPC